MLVTRVLPEDFPAQDNLFQTAFWGKFKSLCGQQALYFFCEFEDSTVEPPVVKRFPLLVLLRKSASGGLYAYAPKAPSVFVKEDAYGIVLENIASAVQPYLPKETVCLRFDVFWTSPFRDGEMPRTEIRETRLNFGTKNHNLRKSGYNYFCPDTVIIDLSDSPGLILSRMRQTTRNSIRRSYRMGVIFSEKDPSFLPEWYKLYQETGERKVFFTEALSYFETLFNLPTAAGNTPSSLNFAEQTAENIKIMAANPDHMPVTAPAPEPEFRIFVAEKDGVLLSGLILALCGKTAYYMYAASRPDCTEYMPSYGLQWETILAARRAGCVRYDLLGIPPNNNKYHPLSGLYTFKTGLGGTPVSYCGCWDYPYDLQAYTQLCNAENIE